MTKDPIFQRHAEGITLNIPIPEGGWVFLALLGVGVAFIALFGLIRAIQSPPAWATRLRLHEKRSLNGLGWFAAFMAPIWLALLLTVLWALFRIVVEFPAVDADQDGTNLRWHVLSLVGLLTALGGLVGTPLALIRVFTNERQTSVAEQSHLTDQINKAVENIGARHSDGTPNLEVRIGGLLALERISKLNPGEHIQIMEILCAYIRENARAQVAAEVTLDDKGVPTSDKAITLRDDLLTAFDIIDRRDDTRRAIEDGTFRLNFDYADFRGLNLSTRRLERATLKNARLQGADLSRAEMRGANLRLAEMNGADLRLAEMQGASLSGAKTQGADLRWTKMQEANLRLAEMQGASLRGAKMQGADLHEAKMQRTDLRGTEMQGAKILRVQMQGADLRLAKMQEANLSLAKMQGADLGGADMDQHTTLTAANFQGAAANDIDFTPVSIATEQLNQLFADASVKRPDGAGPYDPGWPDHWAKTELDWDWWHDRSEFHKAWHAWQDEIGFDRETFEIKQPEE